MSWVVKQSPGISGKHLVRMFRVKPMQGAGSRHDHKAVLSQGQGSVPGAGLLALCSLSYINPKHTHNQSEALWRSRTGYSPCPETSNRAGGPAVGKKCITSVVKGCQGKVRNQPQTPNNAVPIREGGFGEPNEWSTLCQQKQAQALSVQTCLCWTWPQFLPASAENLNGSASLNNFFPNWLQTGNLLLNTKYILRDMFVPEIRFKKYKGLETETL